MLPNHHSINIQRFARQSELVGTYVYVKPHLTMVKVNYFVPIRTIKLTEKHIYTPNPLLVNINTVPLKSKLPPSRETRFSSRETRVASREKRDKTSNLLLSSTVHVVAFLVNGIEIQN